MRRKIVGIIGLVLLLAAPAMGQTWMTYNGDTLPDAASPVWVHENTGGTSTVAGGILTITSDNSNKERWTQNNTSFNLQTGWTVQFKIRVNTVNIGWDQEVEIINIRDGFNQLRIFMGETTIGPDGWQTKNQGADGNTFVPTTTLYDVKGWHTYRITGKNSSLALGGTFNMYRDGNPTPIMTGTLGNTTTNNLIKLGDLNDNGQVSVEWDYVWWANDGAFAPTALESGDPEPVPVNATLDNVNDPDGVIGPTPGQAVDWTHYQAPGSGSATYSEETTIWRHTPFAKALRIYEPNYNFDGGIRQTITATPGLDYAFSAWLNLYAADSTTHSGKVGIDPTGGTDLNDVIWGTPVTLGGGGPTWQNVSVSATAQSTSITVYVNGVWTTSSASERSFFIDDTSLTASAPPAISGVFDIFRMYR